MIPNFLSFSIFSRSIFVFSSSFLFASASLFCSVSALAFSSASRFCSASASAFSSVNASRASGSSEVSSWKPRKAITASRRTVSRMVEMVLIFLVFLVDLRISETRSCATASALLSINCWSMGVISCSPSGISNWYNSSSRSSMVCGRFSGFFCIIFSTSAASSGVISGFSCRIGTGFVRTTFAIISKALVPEKGASPVSISYRVAPRL